MKRRWLYTGTDWEGEETHLDANGVAVCQSDAIGHIATDAEAAREATRRATLWETKQNAFLALVTRHSQGKVSETP